MAKFVESLSEIVPREHGLDLDTLVDKIKGSEVYKNPESQGRYAVALASDIPMGEFKLIVSIWNRRSRFGLINSYSGWVRSYVVDSDSLNDFVAMMSLNKRQCELLYKHMERQMGRK